MLKCVQSFLVCWSWKAFYPLASGGHMEEPKTEKGNIRLGGLELGLGLAT